MPGSAYLEWPKKNITDYLQPHGIKKITFVPYAGVGLNTESLSNRTMLIWNGWQR